MINLQLQTNSLKIGSSVPSISLNYGRNLSKGLLLDQEKVTRVDFSLKGGKKYVHRQTEILSNHGK